MRGDVVEAKLDIHCITYGFASPAAMLREWRINEEMSVTTIALKLDISATSVRCLLRKYNIKAKAQGSGNKVWKKTMGSFFRKGKHK
jgi:hypothetical protein